MEHDQQSTGREIRTLRSFGATCGGETDDTEAFQRAVAWAREAPGRAIDGEGKDCRISTPIVLTEPDRGE